jgi:hypothetical protein
MFESLADQMKDDDREQYSTAQRVVEYGVIAILSVAGFFGLYMAIHLLR